jgi:hypothetical protein
MNRQRPDGQEIQRQASSTPRSSYDAQPILLIGLAHGDPRSALHNYLAASVSSAAPGRRGVVACRCSAASEAIHFQDPQLVGTVTRVAGGRSRQRGMNLDVRPRSDSESRRSAVDVQAYWILNRVRSGSTRVARQRRRGRHFGLLGPLGIHRISAGGLDLGSGHSRLWSDVFSVMKSPVLPRQASARRTEPAARARSR